MPGKTLTAPDSSVQPSIHFLEQLTQGYCGKDFQVRFWDSSELSVGHKPRFKLLLRHPRALRNMFTSPSELAMGEAFVRGDFDVEGDLETAFELADLLTCRDYSVMEKLRLGELLAELHGGKPQEDVFSGAELHGALHSKERDRRAVRYHYDVSNEFYELWLDRALVYSCAYFRSKDDSLETAQTQKLDYICRKLRLRKGDRLLDLGCGWGGLLMHAAKNYGVQSFGITLSVPQAELARRRIREAGLADRCRVEVCDYRDLQSDEFYDKLVSVGMFEHVGETLLPAYFEQAWHLLRPGGVFLNHGISASAIFKRKGPSFINRYVFPDGDLVPISAALRAAESVGFEVCDVESLREHYALTLRHWVRRLEANSEQARSIVDEATYRTWRLYMAGAAHAFVTGRNNLYQVLLSKPEHGESHLPLTREDWYAA